MNVLKDEKNVKKPEMKEWYHDLNKWEMQFVEKYSIHSCIEPMEMLSPIAGFETFRDFQLYLLRKWPIYELNLIRNAEMTKKPIQVNSYLTHLKGDTRAGHSVYILDKLQDGTVCMRKEELHGNVLFDLYAKAGILHDLPQEVESKESIFLVTSKNDYTDVLYGGRITYGEEKLVLELFNAEYVVYSFVYLLSEALDEKRLKVLIYDFGLPRKNLHPLTQEEGKWCEW